MADAECKHEIAQVETAAPEGGKTAFLVKAAWSPGHLAARLLLPGACELAGAVVQTQAYASLRTRLASRPVSAPPSASSDSSGKLAVRPPMHGAIPASQL